jgi:hypothetical protein
VKLRRIRRFFCSSMDTIYSFRVVSTKAGQDQVPRALWAVASIRAVAEGDADVHKTQRRANPRGVGRSAVGRGDVVLPVLQRAVWLEEADPSYGAL